LGGCFEKRPASDAYETRNAVLLNGVFAPSIGRFIRLKQAGWRRGGAPGEARPLALFYLLFERGSEFCLNDPRESR
jgi:hypothetical protein